MWSAKLTVQVLNINLQKVQNVITKIKIFDIILY